MVAFFTYALFVLKPRWQPTLMWQAFTDISLTVIPVVFLVPVLAKGPSPTTRVIAGLLFIPAAILLGFYLYWLIYEQFHGGFAFADA